MFLLVPPHHLTVAEIEDFKLEFMERNIKMHGTEGLGKMDTAEWLTSRPWLKLPNTYVFFSYDSELEMIVGAIRCSLTFSAGGILNDSYNIGYCVRPSLQRRGYGRRQLNAALDFFKSFGDEKAVFLATRDDNIGSQKVIAYCGGSVVHGRGHDLVYRIDY